jgi:hypothetical protein
VDAALRVLTSACLRRKWGDQDGGAGKCGTIIRESDGEKEASVIVR